jgi:hypothetical protein
LRAIAFGISDAKFHDLFHHPAARKSVFHEIIFLGEVRYPEGQPLDA